MSSPGQTAAATANAWVKRSWRQRQAVLALRAPSITARSWCRLAPTATLACRRAVATDGGNPRTPTSRGDAWTKVRIAGGMAGWVPAGAVEHLAL